MHLRGKGYEEFLPTYMSRRHWSDRVREIELPLFPGYIFCKFDVTDRLPLLVIPGVMSVVSFGGTPMPVPEREIAAIEHVVNSGMKYEPWPRMSVGQPVQEPFHFDEHGPHGGDLGASLAGQQRSGQQRVAQFPGHQAVLGR